MKKGKKWLLLLTGGGLIPVAFVLLLRVTQFLSAPLLFEEEYKRFHSVKVGMTEKEVIELLGEPYRAYDTRTAPADYYVPGYSHKRRAITNKVYIYVATEPIAYIYLDERNRVEDVFVGGS